ncbi:MAG: peptide ABC transporter substrate-binding protein [Lachnospiraceae bacterium]|jgi:oligopeptide transport system substrate-binding protein|nr:peptide ABC transporter substrate-binding protein [Lachnospiraceae bacterium]
MRKTKKILSLALASTMVLSLAACGGGSTSTPTTAAETTTAAAADADTTGETTAAEAESEGAEGETTSNGNNIAVCLASEPQTVDPALNSAVDGAIMINHFFEGLVKWVDDGEGNAMTAPGQAESWEKVVNDDGTVTYTMKLRDGIKWSDGKEVTAGDFEYSWKRLANPETAADYCYMIDMVQNYAGIANSESDPDTLGIKAIDDKTLEIVLSYDCPYFEEIMAFPATFPVRQDLVEGNDEWTYDVATYVSNGPYKMKEWSHNAYILAEKNENYYDFANLGPDTIRFTLLDDANAILAAYKSGELDFIEELPPDEMANYLASGELTVADYIGTYYVCFNVEDEIFSNPLIRKAFSLAIDRNYIVENVSQAGEVPATGYVPAGVNDAAGPGSDDFRTVGGEYYSVAEEDYEKNCEEARALLAEAGYPNGEGFPTVEYMYNTNDKHKAIGEALQNMWQEQLGVTVNLSNQDWNVFLESRKQGDYQIARNGWIADYNDPCSFLDMWYTGGGNNDAQYSNKDYDAKIDAAKATAVQEERMKAFHEAEDILIEQDNVLAPVYFYTQPYMIKDDIQGMYYTPLGYFFFGYTTRN